MKNNIQKNKDLAFVRVDDSNLRKELIKFISDNHNISISFSARYNYGIYVIVNYLGISSSDDIVDNDDFTDCGTDIEMFKSFIINNK